MSTTSSASRRQAILAEMEQIPLIVPGKLCKRKGERGKMTGWKLQRWHNGGNRTRYIPADLVDRVQAGTEGYERFMTLAREYAELMGQEALSTLCAATMAKKKPTRR